MPASLKYEKFLEEDREKRDLPVALSLSSSKNFSYFKFAGILPVKESFIFSIKDEMPFEEKVIASISDVVLVGDIHEGGLHSYMKTVENAAGILKMLAQSVSDIASPDA